MNETQWHHHVVSVLRRRHRYQFGQPKSSAVLGGAVACTDACIQMIVLMANGKSVSLNEVRERSQAPEDQPLTRDEALRALSSYGLRYEARSDMAAPGVLRMARVRGPVILCEMYWAHPQWKDYVYAGRRLNGLTKTDGGRTVRPGFAAPFRRAGLTQWTFRGGHAVLLATEVYDDGERLGVVRDPNHNSSARPERPAYDVVSIRQLNRMLSSWPGRLVLAPTRRVF